VQHLQKEHLELVGSCEYGITQLAFQRSARDFF
jgi:hypothetical protein